LRKHSFDLIRTEGKDIEFHLPKKLRTEGSPEGIP